MNIAIVGIVGVPASYGGFESLVETLLDYNEEKINYTVYCSKKSYDNKLETYKNAKLKYLPLKANGVTSILYDGLSLMLSLREKYDIILLLGVSGAIFLPVFKPFLDSKILCNIDGIEWKRNKWNFLTKKFLRFSEYMAIKYSDYIITDNKGISDYVKFQYHKESITIAYGASETKNTNDHLLRKYNLKQGNYFFKVCRIEPENNIELILKAFSEVKEQNIVIVGNWNNSAFGRMMRQRYSIFPNINLIDPIYNTLKLDQLRTNCKAYIHGHSAGGTNPSLVEAMSLRTPIIAFNVNFNRYTLRGNGLYFETSNDLKNIISGFDLVNFSADIEKIYKTFNRHYTKVKIAKEYLDLFTKAKKS